MHFKNSKPLDASAAVATPAPEAQADAGAESQPTPADVAAAPAPLWAAIHSKRKASENVTPMWQRVRSGREATASDAIATPVTSADDGDADASSAPAAASVEAAPAPLWQTVHQEGKRFREPFIWRIAMRKLDNWEPAGEEVVISEEQRKRDKTKNKGGEQQQQLAAASTAEPAAVRLTRLPDEDTGIGSPLPPPPVVVAAGAASEAGAAAPGEAGAGAGPGVEAAPPLWQRVHRQRRKSGSGFFIIGALTTAKNLLPCPGKRCQHPDPAFRSRSRPSVRALLRLTLGFSPPSPVFSTN